MSVFHNSKTWVYAIHENENCGEEMLRGAIERMIRLGNYELSSNELADHRSYQAERVDSPMGSPPVKLK